MGVPLTVIKNPPLTTPWHGEDIFVAYDDYVLMIAEGTGDNLLPEDEAEGYVDYFNLEVYEKSEFNVEKLGLMDTIGGGFMMEETLIADNFYGKSISSVIEAIFLRNGRDDAFDLYTGNRIPDYKVTQLG